MSCEHKTVDVVFSHIVEVSKYGATLLLELCECSDCGHRFIVPYLGLAEIDPIPTDFTIIEMEDGGEITPSFNYVHEVIGIPKRAISISTSAKRTDRDE